MQIAAYRSRSGKKKADLRDFCGTGIAKCSNRVHHLLI